MSEKTLNHILKSNSDGELLDKDSHSALPIARMHSMEPGLKRSYSLPWGSRKKTRNKTNTLSNEDKNEHKKLLRKSLFRKVYDHLRENMRVNSFSNRRNGYDSGRTSQNDVRLPPLKLQFGDKVPGVTGLRNHGNTCFINAVLQCLTHTDCLAEYFVMNRYKNDMSRRTRLASKKYGTKGEVTEQLAMLLKAVWHCQYNPDISNQFKVIIDKYGTQYRGNNQHDAQEFLIWLLDKVHEDLNTATKKSYKPNKSSFDRPDDDVARETLANHLRCNASYVHEVFQAQFRSSLTCLSCKRQSNTFDPFLCISVPIPQQQKRPLYVTVLYISQQPRQVKLGLSLPTLGNVRDLREQLASDTGIPESQMLLTQIDDLGFQRTLSGIQPLSDIRDTDPLYCIEMPVVKDSDDLEKCILLCWVNVLIMDDHCSRFGSPYTMQLNRLTGYPDIQKLLLKEMNMLLHEEVLTTEQDIPLFNIKIVDGINSIDVAPSHLDPTVDHPLYMEEVDQALAMLDDDSGPRHLKLVLEWDLQAKESTIAEDGDVVEEHASVKAVQGVADAGASVTLEECLELYTREEVLGTDDKWHCPFCNRKQQVIKKLGLWSLPEILVVHLKRFRQTSKQRAASKLTTLVDYPLYGLDMKDHVVNKAQDSAPSVPWNTLRKTRRTVPDDYVYDLYAVCNHHGTDVQGGHYTAYGRNPYNGQWYLFDDTKVEAVSDSAIISPAAYILFYQRRGVGGSSHSSSSAASSTSSGSNSDHWVTRMPMFRPPHTTQEVNNSLSKKDSKENVDNEKIESAPDISTLPSITSPRPARKALATSEDNTISTDPLPTEDAPKDEVVVVPDILISSTISCEPPTKAVIAELPEVTDALPLEESLV